MAVGALGDSADTDRFGERSLGSADISAVHCTGHVLQVLQGVQGTLQPSKVMLGTALAIGSSLPALHRPENIHL